eukprot:8533248-Ditylum_brightwellii.AAC.1
MSLKKSTKAYVAYAFLSGANQQKYSNWENGPSHSIGLANDSITFATEGCKEIYKDEDVYGESSDLEEITLATKGDEVVRYCKREKVTCWNCSGNQYANNCPEEKKKDVTEGTTNAKGTVNVTFHDDGVITSNDDGWGVDKGMTGIDFCTKGVTSSYNDALKHKCFQPNLKTNTEHIFHQADCTLDIFSNAGQSMTNLIRDLPGFKIMWYQPDGIVNILSLADVQQDHRVTYDSEHGNCFLAEIKDRSVRKFVQPKCGLYYSVMEDD